MTGRVPLPRAYFASIRLRSRWRATAEALHDGVWLGVLSPDDLRQVDTNFWSSRTEQVGGELRSYEEEAHIRQGLSAWELEAAAHFPPGGTVLVTSAGAGREILGLMEEGFDAVGYEPNRRLVEAGRLVLPEPSRLQSCPWDDFPRHPGGVDVVVIGWGSYMLVRPRNRRRSLLHGARKSLEPGGLVLVSYLVRPDVRYFRTVAVVANVLRRLLRREPVEHGDALVPNPVHYCTSAEVAADLDEAGFDVVFAADQPYGRTLARRR